MAEIILMPRLSDTMTEGVIAAWHKKVGDKIKKGELLAEIETDKATMELESYKDGYLLHLGIDKGGKLQVNDLLAIVGEKEEDISSILTEKKGDNAKTKKKSGIEINQSSIEKKPEEKKVAISDISSLDEVVLMPRLSDTMTEGVIAAWHKKVGDPVKKGEILADIETDKATMELESYKNGTLLYIGADKGKKIAVNDLLCIIGEKSKVDVAAIIESSKQNASSMTKGASEKLAILNTPRHFAKTDTVTSEDPVFSDHNGDGRKKASPLARMLAKEKGIDISRIEGSGDGGRIIKADIDRFDSNIVPTENKKEAFTNRVYSPIKAEEGFTDLPNSQVRNIIARRLSESKFSAPHFYLTMEINMDNAISIRNQFIETGNPKISFNDLVVKAAALALKQHPAVNASWIPATPGSDESSKIRRYHHIHIGIAVAIEDGLIVPVIRFADQKSLVQIASESKALSGKARNKKLQPSEFTGNTFTISNLGMMDIDEFTAVINPPDSCIMAVGKIKEVVVKKTEGFGLTQMMKITLSCDHRSVDGATGAAFLQAFKKLLENPVALFL